VTSAAALKDIQTWILSDLLSGSRAGSHGELSGLVTRREAGGPKQRFEPVRCLLTDRANRPRARGPRRHHDASLLLHGRRTQRDRCAHHLRGALVARGVLPRYQTADGLCRLVCNASSSPSNASHPSSLICTHCWCSGSRTECGQSSLPHFRSVRDTHKRHACFADVLRAAQRILIRVDVLDPARVTITYGLRRDMCANALQSDHPARPELRKTAEPSLSASVWARHRSGLGSMRDIPRWRLLQGAEIPAPRRRRDAPLRPALQSDHRPSLDAPSCDRARSRDIGRPA
jgi:hypothetical protein